MQIPFVDLSAQYNSIKGEVDKALAEALQSFRFINGVQVADFESRFASALNVSHCISTASGTDAIFISLKCAGIGPGDEVIVPAFTWISASEVVSLCGAQAVFADVDRNFYTIDPASVEQCITPRTRAIIAVHLYGQVADLSALLQICERHKLLLIEDACQAHLSAWQGRKAGTIGHIGTFSFYPTKNLGAFGDGGAIVTQDAVLAEKIRRFKNHGALIKDDHQSEGMTSRLDTVQAAVLLAKLRYLEKWNAQRNQHAETYNRYLGGIKEIILPAVRPGCYHNFHIYAIRATDRDKLKDFLLHEGIQTIVHYPTRLPALPPYDAENRDKRYAVAEVLEKEVLSLPIFPELTEIQIEYIARKIKAFYGKPA
jgi:dTDP-4-amino-4,6-dideoxygalactose transaminase